MLWAPLSSANLSLIDSWQYRAAKIALNTKMNIPKCALLLELGWEPVTAFITRQRVSYFKRINRLPVSRLCVRVLAELQRHGEDCLGYVQEINNLRDNFDFENFDSFYGHFTREKLFQDVTSKSSLNLYLSCHVQIGSQTYLSDASDFKSSRLKLLARTNYLPVNKNLLRMSLSESEFCPLCDSGESEDIEHLLLHCPSLEHIRQKYFTIFSYTTNTVGFMELSSRAKILFLIGDIGYAFSNEVGYFYDVNGRMLLLDMFNYRNSIVNRDNF